MWVGVWGVCGCGCGVRQKGRKKERGKRVNKVSVTACVFVAYCVLTLFDRRREWVCRRKSVVESEGKHL